MKKKITATKHIVFQTGKASSELVEMHPLKILLYTIGSFVLSLLMQYFKWVFRLDGSIFGFGLNLISIGFVICAFIMIIHLISRVTSRRTKDSAPKQPIKPDLPRKKPQSLKLQILNIPNGLISSESFIQKWLRGRNPFPVFFRNIFQVRSFQSTATKVWWTTQAKSSGITIKRHPLQSRCLEAPRLQLIGLPSLMDM